MCGPTGAAATRRMRPVQLAGRLGEGEERFVDEGESKAQPRLRSGAEAPRAELGGMLVDVGRLDAEVVGDLAGRYPRLCWRVGLAG